MNISGKGYVQLNLNPGSADIRQTMKSALFFCWVALTQASFFPSYKGGVKTPILCGGIFVMQRDARISMVGLSGSL